MELFLSLDDPSLSTWRFSYSLPCHIQRPIKVAKVDQEVERVEANLGFEKSAEVRILQTPNKGHANSKSMTKRKQKDGTGLALFLWLLKKVPIPYSSAQS